MYPEWTPFILLFSIFRENIFPLSFLQFLKNSYNKSPNTFSFESMLHEPLTKKILHTTDQYIASLKKGGIVTVLDFLTYFPKDIEDRTNVLDNFSAVNIKEKNTVLVTLVSIVTVRTSGGKLLTKAVFEDAHHMLAEWVWFSRQYLGTQLKKYEKEQILISGKVKYDFGKLSFLSPEVEMNTQKLSGEIVPIYSDCQYIPGSWIAGKMEHVRQYITHIPEILPPEIIEKYSFPSRKQAIEMIHFPASRQEFQFAKDRLAYDELYAIHLTSLTRKQEFQNASTGKSLPLEMNPDLVKSIQEKLPFSLTGHQKIALFQILKDMQEPHATKRLLQWDVGSGKTIVAAIAIIHALTQAKTKNTPIQAVFLAPTEILARQHFEGLEEMFADYSFRTELLVGSTPKKYKDTIKWLLKSGNIDIVIGTHALMEENVVFSRLGIVIIDEQHRFGVRQREILEENMSGNIVPHVINMTATPIPRTLALTMYGDQDVSVISEMPAGRKSIHTKVISTENQKEEVERFIRYSLEQGRQVFWVSPLVEESEKLDLANAVATFEYLQEAFVPFRVGLLHGKMKAAEKKDIMEKFQKNEIQILSSTSVIEVGVNIPNATIMCIQGAERFGLSQLHQFRGRVGRGADQSYCYLFSTSGNRTDRLRAMEKTGNGFELAEIDLEIRWPGEVYGVRQSGLPEFKIADITDLELVSQIREDIEKYVIKK